MLLLPLPDVSHRDPNERVVLRLVLPAGRRHGAQDQTQDPVWNHGMYAYHLKVKPITKVKGCGHHATTRGVLYGSP